jgi:hypothetical protein
VSVKSIGLIIEEQCFGEERGMGGLPRATVTLVVTPDGAKVTDAWAMDREHSEFLVNQDRTVWIRIGTIARFMVHPRE